MSLFTAFVLKSTLSDMSIATPAFFWFLFAWKIFLQPFTFSLYVSMGFSRQGYWSGLPCPASGDLPTQGSNPHLLCFLYWQVDSLPLSHLGSPELWRVLANFHSHPKLGLWEPRPLTPHPHVNHRMRVWLSLNTSSWAPPQCQYPAFLTLKGAVTHGLPLYKGVQLCAFQCTCVYMCVCPLLPCMETSSPVQ